MSFLTVGSTTLSVSAKGATRAFGESGFQNSRAMSGAMQPGDKPDQKRKWQFEVAPTDPTTLETFVSGIRAFPLQTCSGDALDGVTLTCLVEIGKSDFIADGLTHLRTLDLTLTES